MNSAWILVCNSTRGRIFEIGDEPFGLRLVDSLTSAEMPELEIFSPSAKIVQRTEFVCSLVAKLDRASRVQRFDEWMIVAPPHFLSMVVEMLTSRLREQLSTTVDRDFNHLDARNLSERLRYSIPVAARAATA